jgi:hypothetical protein
MTGCDEPHDPGWQGKEWSEWFRLEDVRPPAVEGIYRVRLASHGRRLLYIGMSGSSLRGRLGKLRRDVRRGTSREHTAGRVLSAKCGRDPRKLWVSWIDLEGEDRREIYGIEVDLIAAYRQVMRESPACQWHGDG